MNKNSTPFRDRHIFNLLQLQATENLPLDLCLSRYYKHHKYLGATDRRIIGETLYGLIRYKSLFDSLVSPSLPFEKRELEKLQLYRSFDWSRLNGDLTLPEPARLGMSEFLFCRLISIYGEKEGRQLCQLLNEQAPTTIRVNLLKTTRETLLEKWKGKFSVRPCFDAPAGIQFLRREPLFALPEFKEGFFEMQDEGSQLVAAQILAKPREAILDYCSGSGGKTLALAPALQGTGQIYLHDTRPSMLMQARKRLKRAGIQNAQFLSPGHPQLLRLERRCDWVLVDVPCSGTGTLRRNPDQKWKIDAPMIARLIVEQRDIVQRAIAYLKQEGHLVYATCSILPEENLEQIQYFLQNYPLVLAKEPLLLLPQAGGRDGFFAAVFRKSGVC